MKGYTIINLRQMLLKKISIALNSKRTDIHKIIFIKELIDEHFIINEKESVTEIKKSLR